MNTSALGFLESLTKRVKHGISFVGVDIGSSSTKIVQLGLKGDIVYLETYGEINNAPYADADLGRATRSNAAKQANEIQDLLHEVDARSRLCGVAMPFSETLMSPVDLPKRDREQ